MPKGAVGQNGLKIQYFAISPPVGVQAEKMLNVKQLENFEEKLCGWRDFPPKTAPSTGQLRFSVSRLEFLQVLKVVLGQNGLEKRVFGDFPLGLWPAKA